MTAFIHIILVFLLIFFYTIEIAFPEFRDTAPLNIIEIVGLVYFIYEIIYNLLTKKTKSGRKLKFLKEIFNCYLGEAMIIDIVVAVVIAISLAYS